MGDGRDRPWIRWVLAGAAALVSLVLLAVVIGSLVPRYSGGTVIGGVGSDDLRTACKIAGGDDMALCQRVFRIDAALKDGRCAAARLQARPVLALPAGQSPLRDRLRAYAEARVATCVEP